jgi:hypothetical protein
MTTSLSGSSYSRKENTTTYTVLPYGSAIMPGEWLKGRYNEQSRQQVFVSKADSTRLTIAIGPADKFPFSAPSMTGFEFVKSYYYWESGYQKNTLHQKIQLFQTDSVNKFILWKIHSDSVNMLQLVGSKECNCKEGAFQSMTIKGGKGTDLDKAALLRKIYLGSNN